MSLRALSCAMVLSAALIPMAAAEFNPEENVVLADCGIDTVPGHPTWSSSHHMLYYKGAVWTDEQESATNRPDMAGQAKGYPDYPWPLNAAVTMPNNDFFQLIMTKPNLHDGQGVAGGLYHIYDSHVLKCYPYHKKAVHQLPDGNFCASAFVCNHKDQPNPLVKPLKIKVSKNTDMVTLEGHISVEDVFKNIRQSGGTCSEEQVEIPTSGCRIQSTCHDWNTEEGKPGTTADMIAKVKRLAQASLDSRDPNQDPGIFKHETLNERVWDPCKSGRDTCIGGYVTRQRKVTKVARSLSVFLGNAKKGDAGSLTYDISCAGSPSCAACDATKWAAAVAAVFGGPIGGLVGVVAEGTCSATGC